MNDSKFRGNNSQCYIHGVAYRILLKLFCRHNRNDQAPKTLDWTPSMTSLFKVTGTWHLLDLPGNAWFDGVGGRTIVAGVGLHRLCPLALTASAFWSDPVVTCHCQPGSRCNVYLFDVCVWSKCPWPHWLNTTGILFCVAWLLQPSLGYQVWSLWFRPLTLRTYLLSACWCGLTEPALRYCGWFSTCSPLTPLLGRFFGICLGLESCGTPKIWRRVSSVVLSPRDLSNARLNVSTNPHACRLIVVDMRARTCAAYGFAGRNCGTAQRQTEIRCPLLFGRAVRIGKASVLRP